MGHANSKQKRSDLNFVTGNCSIVELVATCKAGVHSPPSRPNRFLLLSHRSLST